MLHLNVALNLGLNSWSQAGPQSISTVLKLIITSTTNLHGIFITDHFQELHGSERLFSHCTAWLCLWNVCLFSISTQLKWTFSWTKRTGACGSCLDYMCVAWVYFFKDVGSWQICTRNLLKDKTGVLIWEQLLVEICAIS